jgi:hypothetical protein
MIAHYTPEEFAITSHGYYQEFGAKARFAHSKRQFVAAISNTNAPKSLGRMFGMFIPIDYWLNRNVDLDIPYVILPNTAPGRNGRYLHVMSQPTLNNFNALRYAT